MVVRYRNRLLEFRGARRAWVPREQWGWDVGKNVDEAVAGTQLGLHAALRGRAGLLHRGTPPVYRRPGHLQLQLQGCRR